MDISAIRRAAENAEARAAELGVVGLGLENELAKIDQRLKPDLVQAEAAKLQAESERQAIKLLQEPAVGNAPPRTIFDTIKTVLETEALYSRDAFLRRAQFHKDPAIDAAEGTRWTVGVLPRASSLELAGLMQDAVAGGNRALAAAVHREAAHRTGLPTASEVDRQTARHVAEMLAKLPVSEADEAKALFARLRAVKAQLEHRFRFLGRRNEAAAQSSRLAIARQHGVSAELATVKA